MEEDNRYELEEAFKQCMMRDAQGNPKDWFNRLDKIETKLSKINGEKYTKSDDETKV